MFFVSIQIEKGDKFAGYVILLGLVPVSVGSLAAGIARVTARR
jgi:hypothetical protein